MTGPNGERYICKGPRVPDSDHMADLRVHCGADITEQIMSVPEDGQDYLVACPKCGTETRTMRTPSAP